MPSAKRERQREGRESRRIAEAIEHKRKQRWRTLRNLGLAVVAIIVVIVVLSLRGGDDKTPVAASASSTSSSSSTAPPVFTYGSGACPNADGSSPKTIDFTDAPQNCIDPTKTYTATFDTTIGTVKVKLDTQTTPGTANNFIVLARYHYYDGTQLFRTAQSIGIIQGGSPHTNSSTDQGPGYSLQDEGFDYASLAGASGGSPTGGPYSYLPGDFVMARASAPNGGAAQFFFAVDDKTASLDAQGVYVKFGTTIEGLDALAFFLGSEPSEQPVHPVTINTVTITES
jgi:cyclophilin family peptidyl-prolyl cis-trans isomerase/predicted nucleic acid-binding Zn ribbon protein